MAPPPRKRAKTKQVEEITFDDDARSEYLTGFHKRKQARIKLAQEQAAQREKEERIVQRKEIRQQRKQDLEAHVAEVNRLLKQAADPDAASSSENEDEDASEGEWGGIQDEQQEEVVDHEEEYVDEDKYTTVTVETVDIDRDGFKRRRETDEEGVEDVKDGTGADDSEKDAVKDVTAKKADGKRVWTKEKPKGDRPKKKKKKFRYENKTERRATRDKQRTKNRAAADARKAKGK